MLPARSAAGHRGVGARARERPGRVSSPSSSGSPTRRSGATWRGSRRLGVVRRAHGGAIAAPARRRDDHGGPPARARAEKIAIGERAAMLVSPGTTIILDSGTTTLCLARALRRVPRPRRGHDGRDERDRARRQPRHDGHHDRRRDPPDHVRGQRGASPRRPSTSSTSTRPSSPCTASRCKAA